MYKRLTLKALSKLVADDILVLIFPHWKSDAISYESSLGFAWNAKSYLFVRNLPFVAI